jgi:hypothetical protein
MDPYQLGNFDLENALGINTCDTTFIANRIANTDHLVRQLKEQADDNERLKKTIAVLKASASQVRALYESESQKNVDIYAINKNYTDQINALQNRCSALEHEKNNSDFSQKEMLAEMETKVVKANKKYEKMCLEVVGLGSLLKENDLFDTSHESRYREAKHHLQSSGLMSKNIQERLNRISKGKIKPKTKMKDAAVNTEPIEPVISMFDDDTITSDSGRESSVSFDDITFGLIPSEPSISVCATNSFVKEKETLVLQNFEVNTMGIKEPTKMVTVATNTEPQQETRKVLVDSSTMCLPSLVTRATCTSSFIKYADVGVNFPEHIPKSVEDILHEMVVDLPEMLSPIQEFVEQNEMSTQTDVMEKEYNTIGTITTLKNVRKSVDYCPKHRQTINELKYSNMIKKEEMLSPASSIQNLATFEILDETEMKNILARFWGLLGEYLFTLMASGKMCDVPSFLILTEKMTKIRDLMINDSCSTNNSIEKENHFDGNESRKSERRNRLMKLFLFYFSTKYSS